MEVHFNPVVVPDGAMKGFKGRNIFYLVRLYFLLDNVLVMWLSSLKVTEDHGSVEQCRIKWTMVYSRRY